MIRARVICGLIAAGLATAMVPGCGGGSNTYNPALIGAGTPTFQLAASPASRTVAQGQSTTYAVTLTAVNGYSTAVAPSVAGLPTGTAAIFDTTPVTPTSGGALTTLTITTTGAGGQGAATPAGTSTLTISATDGSITRNTTVSLVVTGPGSLTGTIQ